MSTRGVFALIPQLERMDDRLLLLKRADGKGWNLPGGRVEAGESDLLALVREVREETGLDVELLGQVGPEHKFQDDVAVAYLCRILGGDLQPTKEAVAHRFCTSDEVKQGHADCDSTLEIKLVGPPDRLGRTGRMLYDGFSIMGVLDQAAPGRAIVASGDELEVVRTIGCNVRVPRLDPYTLTGRMQSS
ncbi:MAG TPA: NUDIX hydrolase [Candidatus Peribacteraceae bacterium]|nr:NUDIX hydrolase [Candidatus Peribacteraceae bacterium]